MFHLTSLLETGADTNIKTNTYTTSFSRTSSSIGCFDCEHTEKFHTNTLTESTMYSREATKDAVIIAGLNVFRIIYIISATLLILYN